MPLRCKYLIVFVLHLFIARTNAIASTRATAYILPLCQQPLSHNMRAALLLALIGTARAVVMTRRRIGAAAAAGLAA